MFKGKYIDARIQCFDKVIILCASEYISYFSVSLSEYIDIKISEKIEDLQIRNKYL